MAAGDAGMGSGFLPQVIAAGEELGKIKVNPLINRIGGFDAKTDLLTELATTDQDASRKIAVFVEIAEKALGTSAQKISDWLNNSLGASGQEVLQIRKQIDEDLAEIAADLCNFNIGSNLGTRTAISGSQM